MSEDTLTGVAIGIGVGSLLWLAMALLTGVSGNSAFVNRHDGIKDMVSEMRNECESAEGVIECEWSEDDLNFVPKD